MDNITIRTVVVGAGASGVAAAIMSAKNGVETLLVESESMIGGDLFSGMPLLGAYTSLGDCCVHGILDEIITTCKTIDLDGYIGPVCDWRTVYGLCFDPEILRLAVLTLLKKYNVKIILNSTVIGVASVAGEVKTLRIAGRKTVYNIACNCVVDATGGGNITSLAGGKVDNGSEDGQFQPVSLLFRMTDVEFEPLLKFIRDNPDEALLAENPVLQKNSTEAALALYQSGYPYVALAAKGELLGKAIKSGAVHQSTAAFITPTSMRRGEVCINATRIAGINCSDDIAVSETLLELSSQIINLANFFKKEVPGFKNAGISSIAHRIGIRETGRIRGEYVLSQADVVAGRTHANGIAKGAHHVDIHGAGTAQTRIPVKNGKGYDIPYPCLIPKELKNVIAAGRCLSSDRGANGSARVMGTCIATGQAAGAATVIFSKNCLGDFRAVLPDEIKHLVG